MIRKILSSMLVVLHIYTFGGVSDGLAALCESASYKLDIAAYTQGGQNRSPGQPGYTKLLLHADGVNGQTAFIDEAGKTITAYGNAHVDTTQSKFGGSSAAFDGNSDYLSLTDSDDWNFGNGDFTVDFWVNFNAFPSGGSYMTFYDQGVTGSHWIIFTVYDAAGTPHLDFYCYDTSIPFSINIDRAPSMSLNTWHHIALVRTGNDFKLFFDGVQQGATVTNSGTMPDVSAEVRIGGSQVGGYYFNGWIDEFRVSKGIARWTSNFTPSDTPYTLTDGDPQGGDPTNTIKDSTGEVCVGKSESASYKLSAGFLYISQTSAPEQTQTIPNFYWQENQSKPDAFDLDDYFISPDGLVLFYNAIKAAGSSNNINVSIDPATNKVSFSQPAAWSGTETAVFTATDSEGNSTQSNPVSLQVEGVNNPPVLDFIPDITVDEGALVKITPHATDLDNESITYSFTAPLDANGEWQTNYTSAGAYTVTVTAKDPVNLADTQDVKITVRNVNRAPAIVTINGIDVTAGQPVILPNINEGETLQITPVATDPDDETVSFGYSSQTAGIDTAGKWLITYDAAGTHTIHVNASDDIATVTQDVTVNVLNVNRTPTLALNLSKYTVAPNENFTITLSAHDPDNDAMTYILKKDNVELSSGSIIDNITVDTSFSGIGDHSIQAIVKDNGGEEASQQAAVDVYDPNADREAINPVMGDFNGDALSDLGLHNSDTGAWEICISQKGVFTAAVDWLTGFGSSRDWWPIGGDFNGDAKTDIGIYNNSTGELKVALSDGTKFTPAENAWLTFSDASYSWIPLTGNFNGDKYTDFCVYNKDTGEWKIAKGTGTGFGEFSVWLTGFGGAEYTPITGDFNADGLTDIGIFNKTSGEIKVAFSNTKAFIAAQDPWATNYAADKDLMTSDFNNDGLTDVGYFDKAAGKWYYALNTGSSFNYQRIWLENFGSSGVSSGHTGDFNGDGLTDAATFDKSQNGINKWAVKLSTNKPQDLLVEIDNGMGGKTEITYQYASTYNNDLLPFPVYVASQISSVNTTPVDRAATYTQTFIYEGGWFDADEREFRGFSKIKVTDTVSGNYTETEFYQGKPPEDGALKGQIKKIQAYDGNGKLISEAVNTWEVRKAGPADGVLGFPYLKEVVQTVYEYGATNPLSTKNEFAYDNLGNITNEICDGDITITGDEKSTSTSYGLPYEQGHNRPQEITLKDKGGNTVNSKAFEYDSKGNLTKETAYWDGANNPSTQYGYDSFGNVTSTTNAEGHVVLTDYENVFYTYPETITNELGHTIQYEYNPKFGVVTHLTDVNGNTTETVYDTLARIIAQKNTQGQIVTSYSYPDFNTKVTTQLNLTKTEYIDGLGRAYKSVSDGEDGTQKRQVSNEVYFNDRGLKEAESLPHYIDEDAGQISYIKYTYDLRGRIKTTISDFPGVVKDATSYINYVNPLYIETTDPRGTRKGTKKDVYGNAIEIIEFTQPGEYHTYYEYDLKGNLTKLTDSKGNITQIQYDRLGRKTLLNDPDTGITTYTYDKLGNLTTQTDNKGQTIIMEYDTLSRLVKKSFPITENRTPITYTYDDTSKENCLGRLSIITTPDVTTSYYYDSEGRAIKVEKIIDGATYTTQTTYDLIGRTTSITYPDGEVVNYAYDTNSGLLETVQGASTYVQDITYNAKGQIKTIGYGNNTQTIYTYGQDLRLSRILTAGQTTLQDLNYDFDKAGNITTLTDNLRSNIRSYTYDDLNRLTKAENTPHPNGDFATFHYEYNSIGNMTRQYVTDSWGGFISDCPMTYNPTGSPITTKGQPPPMPHAVITAGSNNYSYDTNGNMLSAPNKLMTYDAENRLIKIEQSSTITTFTYDADGSRISRHCDPAGAGEAISTTYISSLFEKDSSGETRKYIFAGSNRVASITTNAVIPAQAGIHYYHSDHLGSSNIITDEQGSQVSFTDYTPYGTVATSTGSYNTPYKFTGKELDNTGLYFYAWRYYDPTIGRFCQPDTIIPEPYNPQTLNRYSYCDNNPLNYTDPSGHFAWFVFFALIAKVASAISFWSAVAGFISQASGNQSLARTFFQISAVSGIVATVASIFSFITAPAQAAAGGGGVSPGTEGSTSASSSSAVSGSPGQAQAAAASDPEINKLHELVAENTSRGGLGDFDIAAAATRDLSYKGAADPIIRPPISAESQALISGDSGIKGFFDATSDVASVFKYNGASNVLTIASAPMGAHAGFYETAGSWLGGKIGFGIGVRGGFVAGFAGGLVATARTGYLWLWPTMTAGGAAAGGAAGGAAGSWAGGLVGKLADYVTGYIIK